MSHENKKKGYIIGIKEIKQRHRGLDVDLWRKVNKNFPVRITRSWYNRMQSFDGPLAKQVLPHESELNDDPRGLIDPVGEKKLSPVPWLISKHKDRALLLVSKRCHLYCRYCFRRNHEGAQEPTDKELDQALTFIANNNFEEVILSGGDPLILSDKKLESILSRIKSPVVRIHTRAPISAPHRVTNDLCKVLAVHSSVWVIVHVNHPDELSADVIEGIGILQKHKIPLLNQSVLLAGVNDDPEVLAQLFVKLVRLKIFPYYLHHTDAAYGNRQFRVSLERGVEIWKEVRNRISGLALPRYVIDPPDGSGKIDVLEYIKTSVNYDPS